VDHFVRHTLKNFLNARLRARQLRRNRIAIAPRPYERQPQKPKPGAANGAPTSEKPTAKTQRQSGPVVNSSPYGFVSIAEIFNRNMGTIKISCICNKTLNRGPF
jgi:hypothetical protein